MKEIYLQVFTIIIVSIAVGFCGGLLLSKQSLLKECSTEGDHHVVFDNQVVISCYTVEINDLFDSAMWKH